MSFDVATEQFELRLNFFETSKQNTLAVQINIIDAYQHMSTGRRFYIFLFAIRSTAIKLSGKHATRASD